VVAPKELVGCEFQSPGVSFLAVNTHITPGGQRLWGRFRITW
jgi:hypothetical protein